MYQIKCISFIYMFLMNAIIRINAPHLLTYDHRSVAEHRDILTHRQIVCLGFFCSFLQFSTLHPCRPASVPIPSMAFQWITL